MLKNILAFKNFLVASDSRPKKFPKLKFYIKTMVASIYGQFFEQSYVCQLREPYTNFKQMAVIKKKNIFV